MNRRWLRFFVLILFLIINISCAMFFLNRNTQNNYSNYAQMQDNLLYSIVNTTNKDVDTLITAMEIAKTSGGQAFYLYNKTEGRFVVYKDRVEEAADVEMETALLKHEMICGTGDANQRVMSALDVTIDGKEYILALGTLTTYIDANLNTSQYNMFIILEFTVLYLILVCLSLRSMSVDKKHDEELEQLANEFAEYRNKLSVEAEHAELEKQSRREMEGIYPKEFFTKLKERLKENKISYVEHSFLIAEEMEAQLVEMANRYNIYFAKDDKTYYVLLIKDMEQEEPMLQEIERYGGTEFGKSI